MKSARRSLQLHLLIVALYAALAGWWVWFFLHEDDFLVRHMQSQGHPLSPEQVSALDSVTAASGRMFLGESAFMLLLMVGSAWLLVRAMRREVALARQQRNFLSAVTHELRSPIASARLYLETLLLGRAEESKKERYLRHAHLDLQRLSSMVEDLLEGRRIAEHGVAIKPEPADLGEIVNGQLEHLRTFHAPKGARVEVAVEGPLPVRVDVAAVVRVLDNLVSNGVKYGGPQPQVEIAARAEGRRVVLTVRDHGPGLQGADPGRIFEPFVRGGDEAVRTQQGVGLGLFIVRELVTAHGGTVGVSDDLPGGGACFRIELPLAPVGGSGNGAGNGNGKPAGEERSDVAAARGPAAPAAPVAAPAAAVPPPAAGNPR